MIIKLLLLPFLLIVPTLSSAGIGGSEGGPGARIWKLQIPNRYTVDWPVVQTKEGRRLKINQFCIENDQILRTLQKYRRLGVRYDNRNQNSEANVKDKLYLKADRYFDESNCRFSSDPRCNITNAYIEDVVEIPIYRGKPKMVRGDTETMSDFIFRAPLHEIKKVKIPKCKTEI